MSAPPSTVDTTLESAVDLSLKPTCGEPSCGDPAYVLVKAHGARQTYLVCLKHHRRNDGDPARLCPVTGRMETTHEHFEVLEVLWRSLRI